METLEYIDAYFQETLSANERKEFEQKCEEEEEFAREVAFYISARKMLRDEMYQEKKQEWENSKTGIENFDEPKVKKVDRFKWIRYAAAACIVLAIATYLFEKPVSVQKLATNYISTEFANLSQTMGAAEDSMELAKAAYNKKDFTTSLAILNATLAAHPDNADALKYTGIVYLVTNNYEKAFIIFDELSKRKELFSNPGLFYKALTLLKRNTGDDKQEAKRLLEQVVSQNLEGSKEAKDWLKKF